MEKSKITIFLVLQFGKYINMGINMMGTNQNKYGVSIFTFFKSYSEI